MRASHKYYRWVTWTANVSDRVSRRTADSPLSELTHVASRERGTGQCGIQRCKRPKIVINCERNSRTGAKMIDIIGPDGKPDQITGDRVVRLRRAWSDESTPPAKTHIDWLTLKFAQEEATSLAAKVAQENKNLAQLKLPTGEPVWFDAKVAAGPIRIITGSYPAGTKSAFMLGSKLQYVANTPEEVAAVISSAGGSRLPIPSDSAFASFAHRLKNLVAPTAAWD